MVKYYYNRPLEIAYMGLHHDVRFEDKLVNQYLENARFEALFAWLECLFCEPLYVEPNCSDIFKPQVGDLVKFGSENWAYFKAIDPEYKDNFINLEIIQRNGKAFFMPEVEDDK